MGAAAAACISPVLAKDAGNLKGISIDVKWSTITTFRRDGVTRTTRLENRGLQMYIGLSGHVFEYSGFRDYWGKTVVEFGKARPAPGNGMVATTIVNGQLTRISKWTRGFMIQTINVSPSLDSCTFAVNYKPDAEGQIVGFDPYTERPYELISQTIVSNTCVVKAGNIFSTEQ